MNQLRIIAGLWRGRKISFIDQDGLRPTPDRIRETLFNWLQSELPGAHCLDLFAGSGALSIEAASRGAASVTCVEASSQAAACIRKNLSCLPDMPLKLIRDDAQNFLRSKTTEQAFDLVFLDPPFAKKLLAEICLQLEESQLLAKQAKIYLESDEDLEQLALPKNWALLRNKKAGQVYYGLCQREI